MIVAQHPGRRRLDRALERRAPQRLELGSRRRCDGAAPLRNVPVEQQFGFDQQGVQIVRRQRMIDARRDGQHRGQRLPVQGHQHVDGGRIAILDRSAGIARHHAFAAEILEHEQPLGKVRGVDFGCGEAACAQRPRHRHERLPVLGTMRDRAIRFAVPQRRPVRSAWRVHQNGRAAVLDQTFVDAGRGVALEELAFGIREPRLLEEAPDGEEPFGALRKRAEGGDARLAIARAPRRDEMKGDVEPIGRQQSVRAIGPFEQGGGALDRFFEAELDELARLGNPIEIGVDQRKARQRVALDERERRARHFEPLVLGESANQRARERGLAGAEIAGERNEIAGGEDGGDIRGQPARRLLVRKHQLMGGRGQIGPNVQRAPPRYSAAAARSATCSSGKAQTTVVPRPTAESSFTVPPCSSTNERTIERPSPVPRCREPSAWVSKRSNTRSWISVGMPGPRSLTRNTTASLRRSAASVTTSPGGEKPMALTTRLYRIWRSRRSSAVKLPIPPSARISSLRPCSASRSRTASATASTTVRMSTLPRLSVITPASMVARSRMSLMMASSEALEELK